MKLQLTEAASEIGIRGVTQLESGVIYAVVDADNFNAEVIDRETKKGGIWTVYKSFNNVKRNSGTGLRELHPTESGERAGASDEMGTDS